MLTTKFPSADGPKDVKVLNTEHNGEICPALYSNQGALLILTLYFYRLDCVQPLSQSSYTE